MLFRSNKEILRINENLEKIVEEKTLKNNELTQMMANQDKLAMIGEVTAGITHDLNTPLSSILLGSENLQETIENLLSISMQNCTTEQLAYAIARANEQKTGIHTSGLQAAKDIAALEKLIKETDNNISSEQAREIAKASTRAKISPEEKEVVRFILQQPNPLAFIHLIYK